MLVSTIIPVYNAENYIKKCVDSLINAQISTIENEIILINDGSTDNSLKICQEYAKFYKNIKVISQNNSGPSAARNIGLANAKGKWITFVDSDDFVASSYYTRITFNLDKKSLLIFNYKKIGKNKIVDKDFLGNKNIPSSLILSNTLKYSNILWFPWNKVYNKKVLEENNIKFNPTVKIGEDTLFNIAYLQHVKDVRLIEDSLYNYVEVENSLTHKKYKYNLLLNMENHYKERKRLQPDQLEDIANYYVNHILFWLINNVKNSDTDKLNEVKEIRNSIIYNEVFKHYKYNWMHFRKSLIIKFFELNKFNLLFKTLKVND